MNGLYIHASHHGSVTIVSDNEVIVHAQLDRFNRYKNSGLPSYSVIEKILSLKIKFNKLFISFLKNQNHLKEWLSFLNQFKVIDKNTEILYDFRNHHLYHAYCARFIYTSSWDFLICDESGGDMEEAYETESFYQKINDQMFAKKAQITTLDKTNIGHLYSRYTLDMGFDLFEEGKTMALATYGQADEKLYDQIYNKKYLNYVPSKLTKKDTAATIQKVFEDYTFDLFKKWVHRYSHRYSFVCFGGGFAQNIINNTKIQNNVFNTVLPDPCNGDFGISLGAANYYNKLKPFKGIFMGFNQSLDTSLFKKVIDTNYHDIAKILLKEPVAIFQSRSEQGQRALGNRSLLMNPLDKDCIAKVNKIKKREWFRPFAGTVLAEKKGEYFEIPLNTFNPYMMFMYKIKDERLKNIASIDGYSRIQTLKLDFNKHYYNLIKEFENVTSLPIVLNTSLNIPGHTIVETLGDVKEMMNKTELKYCYLPEINKLIIND
jgi:predicted NodU family carbamoyl transferase